MDFTHSHAPHTLTVLHLHNITSYTECGEAACTEPLMCTAGKGYSLEVRAFELLEGVGKMQHLGVELPDKRLQLVHGVEDFHTLRVRVEAHLEGSRHGRHPTSMVKISSLISNSIYLHNQTMYLIIQFIFLYYLNFSLASSKLSAT